MGNFLLRLIYRWIFSISLIALDFLSAPRKMRAGLVVISGRAGPLAVLSVRSTGGGLFLDLARMAGVGHRAKALRAAIDQGQSPPRGHRPGPYGLRRDHENACSLCSPFCAVARADVVARLV